VKKVSGNEKKIGFEGWFSLSIPEEWEYEMDEDVLNIYNDKNGRGALQITFFKRKEIDESLRGTAENHLNRFIRQFKIEIIEDTYKVIEAPKLTIANVSGRDETDFIKVWTVVNQQKMLLITYISPSKTKELAVAENIVYSIEFET